MVVFIKKSLSKVCVRFLMRKMETNAHDSSVREPLSSSRPRRYRKGGHGVKFSLVCLVFQAILLVLFSVLVDYGQHALPPQSKANSSGGKNGNKTTRVAEPLPSNDIVIYYPSKCRVEFKFLLCTRFNEHI